MGRRIGPQLFIKYSLIGLQVILLAPQILVILYRLTLRVVSLLFKGVAIGSWHWFCDTLGAMLSWGDMAAEEIFFWPDELLTNRNIFSKTGTQQLMGDRQVPWCLGDTTINDTVRMA